jgi:hypothetical protein
VLWVCITKSQLAGQVVSPLTYLVYLTWILYLLYCEGLNPLFLLCSSLFNVALYQATSYVCLRGLLVCWASQNRFRFVSCIVLDICLPMPGCM